MHPRPLHAPVLAVVALIAACSSAPPAPVTVVIAAPSTPAAPPAPEPTAPPRAADAELSEAEAMALINRYVQKFGPGRSSVGKEAGGRIVKRDANEAYEEDFFLKDVEDIVYVHEPEWIVPHVARVKIKPGGITRFHRGEEEWNVSTIPTVSFAVSDKHAAEEILRALKALLAQKVAR